MFSKVLSIVQLWIKMEIPKSSTHYNLILSYKRSINQESLSLFIKYEYEY